MVHAAFDGIVMCICHGFMFNLVAPLVHLVSFIPLVQAIDHLLQFIRFMWHARPWIHGLFNSILPVIVCIMAVNKSSMSYVDMFFAGSSCSCYYCWQRRCDAEWKRGGTASRNHPCHCAPSHFHTGKEDIVSSRGVSQSNLLSPASLEALLVTAALDAFWKAEEK
jgi:hypothetical protein